MSSPSLAELQGAMAARILGNEDFSPLDGWIRVPPGVDPRTRFAIHQDAYPARIASSLAEAFPAVANILGDGSLARLTARFIECGLPAERNLNHVGRGLPAFLASDPLTPEVPFLPDLAALEWAIYECFHCEVGSDFDPATISAFTHDDWVRTRVVFRPGTAVVSSAWPIHELWRTRDLDRCEIAVELRDHPEQVLVHRVGLAVETQSIDLLEAEALERLISGMRLDDVMTSLSKWDAKPDRVGDFFASWSSLGIISACCPD